MHIPDSAISPITSIAAGLAMAPVWATASARLRKSLATKQVPHLAIGAAFCFTVMMFNLPVPGGTTVHPIGGTLLAILLGPWAAAIGVTVALAIQALFFADGGVLALGANCFTMAFAMPFCGYAAYRVLAAGSPERSLRRIVAAGVGAYVGLNAAALLTSVILGIQPALFHDYAGHALYFPFGLKVTLPAIMSAHLLVAGIAEAAVTALAVKYLLSAGVQLHGIQAYSGEGSRSRSEMLWVGLGAFIALTPLGLLARGEAWGEWSAEDISKRAGYLPGNLASIEQHGWKGFNLLPDYLSDRGAVFYVFAALIGGALICLAVFALGRWLRKEDAPSEGDDDDAGLRSEVRPGEVPSWMMRANVEIRSAEELSKPKADSSQRALGMTTGRTLGRRASFLEKTLAGIAAATRETLFTEKLARSPGLLQRLDPRAKVLGLFGLVVAVSFVHKLLALGALCIITLIMGRLSNIPASAMLRRVWTAIILFSGAIVLPSALNIVTPGPSLFILCKEPLVSVTIPGISLAAILLLRMGVAVSCVVLLTLTTRWDDLLYGLRSLFIPRTFVVVLAMAYRYLGVLMQTVTDAFTARLSRTIGRTVSGSDRGFLGNAVGSLFGKTAALTDDVHNAMVSRGWTGEAHSLRSARLRRADIVWLAGSALVIVLIFMGERGG